MIELTLIQKIAITILPLIFAITLHEVAHGYVAYLFGDQTARLAGRLSLNPTRHIDLMGTIIVPVLMLMVSNFIFGWAKPVPVDPRNMAHPRRDMALVSIAGPVANLLMALFWGAIQKLGMTLEGSGQTAIGLPLDYMGEAGILINLVLAVLNLLPLPPLDGGNFLRSVLPPRASYQFGLIEPYSFWILILLLVTGVLPLIMGPLILVFFSAINYLFGLG